MIKNFLCKYVWGEYDRESQEMAYELKGPQALIHFLCGFIWIVFWLFVFLPGVLVIAIDEGNLSTASCVVLFSFYLLALALDIFMTAKFRGPMKIFEEALAERIYYLRHTKKGKTLEPEDFKTLFEENRKLFALIASANCTGYCYSVCYEICQLLEKGKIEFVAIKAFSPHEEEENYTMHVLYVNNGWAFDTFSVRQYPLREIHRICDAEVFKSFSFEEIKGIEYDDFRKAHWPEVHEWVKEHSCYVDWKQPGDD